MNTEFDNETLEAFTQAKFNVQNFMIVMAQQQELSQTLLRLNSWKNQNASQMSTVLKEQTDAVISIAEDVQALLQKVENVSTPICQLLEAITTISKNIVEFARNHRDNLSDNVNVRLVKFHFTCIKVYSRMVKRTEGLLKSIEHLDQDAALAVQRVINLYIKQTSFIKNLDELLLGDPPIEDMMSELITQMFLRSYEMKDVKLTKSTVLSAQHLNQVDCIQKIICNHIVKPVLLPVLCDDNLQKLKGNIGTLYEEAFKLLDSNFKIFLRKDIFDFDFIYECYWPVANELMRNNLLSITDAGHPDAFYTNFTETEKFIKKLSNTYGCDSNNNYDSFKDHLTRFSLYVYYEIRHQHCAYVFESSIMQETANIDKYKNFNFEDGMVIGPLNAPVSIVLKSQLQYMFDKNVFLMPLLDQFVKLSIALLMRYVNWIEATFANNLTGIKLDNKYDYLLLLCDLAYFMDNRLGFKVRNDADLSTKSIYAPAAQEFREDLWNVVLNNYVILYAMYEILEEKFTREMSEEIIDLLKNMFSIPRLYRRTNRSVPTEHSSYIDSAAEVVLKIHKYYSEYDNIIKSVCSDLVEKIIMSACLSMKSIIEELISSINKTESSLRRLKNRNAVSPTGEDLAANTNSDEYKIRMQVALDVKQFVSKVKPSLHKQEQLFVLDELMVMVGA